MPIRWPIFLRRVEGHSMLPTLKEGQVLLACSLIKPRPGRILIARTESGEVVKRVKTISNDGQAQLTGDNKNKNHNANCVVDQILGVVIYPRTP